ncbi:hypothetical protein PR048_002494 [Dryococelus australis]|uniref:Uncharacterized protein n=1 Tax=Dryococelus australis TaxID=614101 RepID=A0ABQ9IKB1_9NEOP|nr:hypothetical protein PR048_002494 [Dryococelus australis]
MICRKNNCNLQKWLWSSFDEARIQFACKEVCSMTMQDNRCHSQQIVLFTSPPRLCIPRHQVPLCATRWLHQYASPPPSFSKPAGDVTPEEAMLSPPPAPTNYPSQ